MGRKLTHKNLEEGVKTIDEKLKTETNTKKVRTLKTRRRIYLKRLNTTQKKANSNTKEMEEKKENSDSNTNTSSNSNSNSNSNNSVVNNKKENSNVDALANAFGSKVGITVKEVIAAPIPSPAEAVVEILTNKWNPWTDKSKDVPFNYKPKTKKGTDESGIGDGEYKVAAELSTDIDKVKPLGQNSRWDLQFKLNNQTTKADVKKLENEFRLGVIGKSSIRIIQKEIHTFIYKCFDLYNNYKDTEEFTKEQIKSLEKIMFSIDKETKQLLLRTDEISKTKFIILPEVLKFLHAKQEKLKEKLGIEKIDMYDPITGNKKYVSKQHAYKVYLADNTPIEEIKNKLENKTYDICRLLDILDHPYVNDNGEDIIKKINNLKNILENEKILLIFVDEKKGYYIMTNTSEKIIFTRITQDGVKFEFVNKI